MRLQLASVLLLAGTVVGCANNPPPPPPPMAAAPEPAPMTPPPPAAPMAGVYRGPGMATGSSACRNPRGQQNARVRGSVITFMGMRGAIGPDGQISGRNISGTVMGDTADVTVKRGSCSFEYKMTNTHPMPASAGSMPMNGSSSMPMNGSSSMPMNSSSGM